MLEAIAQALQLDDAERAHLYVASRERAQAQATQALAKVRDDAGLSLIEPAIAFVLNHPAVTWAIIGPRTSEQVLDPVLRRR